MFQELNSVPCHLPPAWYIGLFTGQPGWRGGTGQDYNLEATLQKTQTTAFHTSPLALTQSRCTASSHSATPRKSTLNPALYHLLPSGCRLCGLEVGRPAFQPPMFEKCDSLPKRDLFDMFV